MLQIYSVTLCSKSFLFFISKTNFFCDEVTEQVELNNLFLGFSHVSFTILEEIGHEAGN